MKTKIMVLMLISFFVCPIWSHAAHVIHLKSGGRFVTPQYWEERSGMIFFFVSGGTMGIEKNTVKNIEKTKLDDEYTLTQTEQALPRGSLTRQDESDKETVPDAEGKSVPSVNLKEEKVDLKPYQDKMDTLTKELNATLARIKKAKANDNMMEKEAAIAENRKISDEMWKLTDELKKNNHGKLPDNWWEGVGR